MESLRLGKHCIKTLRLSVHDTVLNVDCFVLKDSFYWQV
jgi:hypothetical protein